MTGSRDNRPHIIIATTAFSPFVGGAEIAIQELISDLSKYFRFTVITARLSPALNRRDTWLGADVIRVGWGTRFDKLWLIIVFPWYAWQLSKKSEAQLVWAIMASYAGAGALSAAALGILPYVLTLQEGDDLLRIEKRIEPFGFLFRKIFAKARSVHAIAPFLSEWAQKLGAKNEILVLPNGVRTERFSLSDPQKIKFRREIREELHIPQDAPVVLSISRLVEKNGLKDLIEAVKVVENVHVIIVGDGALKSELVESSRSFSNRIHFVGTQSQEDISKFAASSDLFCRPAHSEGQGIVFLEALCMGLPVVATRVGGIPSIIEDGVHGILVEVNDVVALRKALITMLDDAGTRERMQKNGQEHVKKFEWTIISPIMRDWLQRNLADR